MAEIIKRLRGHHEPQEEKVFYEVLKVMPPGAKMIELGSFWAYYSMWFNKTIINAENYMIEPNPEKLELGKEHFRLNNMKGVFTRAFMGRDSAENGTFEDWDGKAYTIPQLSIDDYLESIGLEFLHLLHSDIQGAEYQMLLGCRRSLKAGKIGYIFISTHGDCHDKCLAFLLEHGLSIIASHTIEQSFSADGLIVAASPYITRIPPVSISRFGHDDTGESSNSPAISEIRDRLNPHLLSLGTLPFDRPFKRISVEPKNLMSSARFDIIPKFLYAEFRAFEIDSPWARRIYEAHLQAFNECREGDGSGKSRIEDFTAAFDDLLESVRSSGFVPDRSLIPMDGNGVIIDGAHRVAACLLYDRKVEGVTFDMHAGNFNFEYFLRKGLDPDHCDAIALKYVRINPNAFIATVFPSAVGREQEIRDILTDSGEIFYARQVEISQLGSVNLVRQMYDGEPWVGSFDNGFAGAKDKAANCFRKPGPVRVYVFSCTDLERVKSVKHRIRDLFGIENHSVHINDTHQEAVALARLLLNANSVHFLNNARMIGFPNFLRHLENFRKVLREQGVNEECLCIDGSSVMAAYGIREGRDLDYLHFGYDGLVFDYPPELIGSHNTEVEHHVTTRDDIIFNPANHFYYYGIKFASLGVIRAMKQKRAEPKDSQDVALIDGFLTTPLLPPHVWSGSVDTAPGPVPAAGSGRPRIIGLVPARNEKNIIAQCLRALSLFTDAIVYLDDASTDETSDIVASLAQELRIERIIRKKEWVRDEPGDRNALLNAGRALGGTHFIVIDADEVFSANLLADQGLRQAILSMKPGDRLAMNWIQLWRSTEQFRFDRSVWTWNYKDIIFCDDGRCSYSSEFIHTPRVPENLSGTRAILEGYDAGLLHFQFVNWRNLLLKQAWYRCLEHIREPSKPAREINSRYAPSKDEEGLGLQPAPSGWFDGYPFFDRSLYDLPDCWREEQVLDWFEKYGREHFAGLDIWDVDWRPNRIESIRVPDTVCDGGMAGQQPVPRKSNLVYWKELQNKGYFENQNTALLASYGEEKYREMFGSTDPGALRDTSGRDFDLIGSFLSLDTSMTAAVIGCGYGRETLAIAPRVRHVYGIDVSHTILDKAQEYLATNSVFNFTPVLAENWRKLVPPTLDFVYSITVFQHLTRDLVLDYLAGLAEKLSPTGKALCQFAELTGGTKDAELKAYEPSVNWSTAHIRAAMAEAGLSLVTLRTLDVGGGLWHWAFFERQDAQQVLAAPPRADLQTVNARVVR